MHGSDDAYCMPAPNRLFWKTAGHEWLSPWEALCTAVTHYHIRWSRVVPLDWEWLQHACRGRSKGKTIAASR